MIPQMQRELVDRRHWVEADEFMDYVAVSQAMPGVFAVNMATIVGYNLRGIAGAITAIIGNILMPIVFILLLAMFFRAYSDNVYVEHIFMGLRPAVVALVAAPVFTMARSADISWRNSWIPIVAALLIWLLGMNPVYVILIAASAGCLSHWIKKAL